jgi:hypothetical protein
MFALSLKCINWYSVMERKFSFEVVYIETYLHKRML